MNDFENFARNDFPTELTGWLTDDPSGLTVADWLGKPVENDVEPLGLADEDLIPDEPENDFSDDDWLDSLGILPL